MIISISPYQDIYIIILSSLDNIGNNLITFVINQWQLFTAKPSSRREHPLLSLIKRKPYPLFFYKIHKRKPERNMQKSLMYFHLGLMLNMLYTLILTIA